MAYRAHMNLPHPALDYSAQRPMARWSTAQLNSSIDRWLSTNPPHLELASLALDELKHRREELSATLGFAERKLEPISWLTHARAQVLKDLCGPGAPPKTGTLGGTVYVILRDGYTAANQHYGVYVGSTRRTLEQRFTEHRTTSKAGRGLIAHGIEPLYSLFTPLGTLPKTKKKLLEWETMLNNCLAKVVPKVSGDVAF